VNGTESSSSGQIRAGSPTTRADETEKTRSFAGEARRGSRNVMAESGLGGGSRCAPPARWPVTARPAWSGRHRWTPLPKANPKASFHQPSAPYWRSHRPSPVFSIVRPPLWVLLLPTPMQSSSSYSRSSQRPYPGGDQQSPSQHPSAKPGNGIGGTMASQAAGPRTSSASAKSQPSRSSAIVSFVQPLPVTSRPFRPHIRSQRDR